jgi:transposase
MAKALSVDLRHRVVAAIVEGISRRQAAARFGVSTASAVRWYQRFKASGTVAPSRQGGDRRSGWIEAHRGQGNKGQQAQAVTRPRRQSRFFNCFQSQFASTKSRPACARAR